MFTCAFAAGKEISAVLTYDLSPLSLPLKSCLIDWIEMYRVRQKSRAADFSYNLAINRLKTFND